MLRSTRAPRLLVLLTLAAAGVLGTACGNGGTSTTGTGGGTGSGGTGTGGSAPTDNCTKLCATTATLKCASSTTDACVALCETQKVGIGWCATIAGADIDCLSKEPATSFTCDMNGAAVAKPSACQSESIAMQACWYNGPPGGLPDVSQACNAVCASESALSCADQSCASNCMAGVMPGKTCNGAFAAFAVCASLQTASSFECTTGTPPLPTVKAGFCDFPQLVLLECLQHS